MNSRRLDEAECVVSVLLSIAAAHLLGVANVAWAAFAGLLVMRGHAADTVHRGSLRIVGTMIGGALAYWIVPLLLVELPFSAAGLFVIGTMTIYMALTARRAYAWLILGLTVIMVLLDKVEHPTADLAVFVRNRIAENAIGTSVCVLVSLASTLTFRRWWPAARSVPVKPLGWHRHAFFHAVQGGVALAALMVVALTIRLPALTQSGIAIVAVMLVPAADLSPSTLSSVSNRLFFRFVGCMAGALFSGAAVALANTSMAVMLAATALGVAIGRFWENEASRFQYAGTQFTFAVLIMLVPDNVARVTISPGWDRLLAVLIGMAMVEPVLIAGYIRTLLTRRDKAAASRPVEQAPDAALCSILGQLGADSHNTTSRTPVAIQGGKQTFQIQVVR